jgi:phosphatidylglycerol:prolipoprotein diacylglycerol transferase
VGHWSDYSDDPLSALRIWEGGISLVGGIAGAVMFAYPLMRRFNYRFLQVMDSAAIGLAFGIMIGRIGDLIIGDHLGKPTDFFLGWAYRGGDLPGPWAEGPVGTWTAQLPGGFIEELSREGARLANASGDVLSAGAGVHQTALYDLFIAAGLFLFLRWLNRRPRREGVLIMSFAIWYGTGRVITDFLRIDKTYFGLTGSQLTSIAVVLISLYTLLRFARRRRGDDGGDDVAEPEDADEERRMEPASAEPTTRFTPPPEPGSGSEEPSGR